MAGVLDKTPFLSEGPSRWRRYLNGDPLHNIVDKSLGFVPVP